MVGTWHDMDGQRGQGMPSGAAGRRGERRGALLDGYQAVSGAKDRQMGAAQRQAVRDRIRDGALA